MKPIFGNSAFVTIPEWMVLGAGSSKKIKLKVRYGVFEHPKAGLTLIDAGYGPQSTEDVKRSRFLKLYAAIIKPQLISDQSPEQLLLKLGFKVADVKTVIITHFHADHISHLKNFPNARFVVSADHWKNIKKRSYLKSVSQGEFTELLPDDFEERLDDVNNYPKVLMPNSNSQSHDIFGDGSVLAIDLSGHSHNHFGICFPKLEKPLLYAVDVQWLIKAVMENRLPGMPAKFIAHDQNQYLQSVAIAKKFVDDGGELMLCHDPNESVYDYVLEGGDA